MLRPSARARLPQKRGLIQVMTNDHSTYQQDHSGVNTKQRSSTLETGGSSWHKDEVIDRDYPTAITCVKTSSSRPLREDILVDWSPHLSLKARLAARWCGLCSTLNKEVVGINRSLLATLPCGPCLPCVTHIAHCLHLHTVFAGLIATELKHSDEFKWYRCTTTVRMSVIIMMNSITKLSSL